MIAVIISFLLDCLLNVFLRSLGSILGSCEYLLALFSLRLGGDSRNIVFLVLLFVLASDVIVLGVWSYSWLMFSILLPDEGGIM